MLKAIDKTTCIQHLDKMYKLAQQSTSSSYPTYNDGIKTKDDFVNTTLKAFSRPEDHLLGYYQGDELIGWVHYYVLEASTYVGILSLLASRDFDALIVCVDQFLVEQFPGYELWYNFPQENIAACTYLENNHYALIESSQNFIYSLSDKNYLRPSTINEYQSEDELTFRQFHQYYETSMYWTSDRLLSDLGRWRILVCRQAAEIVGFIYSMKQGLNFEVFGVDFKEAHYNESNYRDMIRGCLWDARLHGAKHLNYFVEETTYENILNEEGFHSVGVCLTYMKKAN